MNRALVLDRDGVINVDKRYVFRVEDFEFIPGIFDLCRIAEGLGFLPIVITNQAGIGRGFYTEDDFQHLTKWMLSQFVERGARIGRVYHCPYHPTAGIGPYRRDSDDRKPKPGMILRARSDFQLDLSRSVLVGDKDSDIEAGRAAGVGYNVRLVHEQSFRGGADRLEFPSIGEICEWLGTSSREFTTIHE